MIEIEFIVKSIFRACCQPHFGVNTFLESYRSSRGRLVTNCFLYSVLSHLTAFSSSSMRSSLPRAICVVG